MRRIPVFVGGIRRTITVLLVGSSLFILFGGTRAWADAPKQSEAEAGFTADLNHERTNRGLGPLAVASDLVAWARQHSADMAAAGKPYHDPNIQTQVQNWQVLGDNVGSGPNEPSIHTGFMNSQVHRDEILEPRYTEVGVGCYWAGNVLYVTEVFRLPERAAGPVSRAATPARPAPAPRVVTRTVAAPGPAPAPAPAAPPTTAAPSTTTAPSTSTSMLAAAPQWPPASTVLNTRSAASHTPKNNSVSAVTVAAAVLLMLVAGIEVSVLRRRS